MTPSVPTAVTPIAATHGSSQQGGQVHFSSSTYEYTACAERNGDGLTGTAGQTHGSDITCVGMWATKEEHQRTETPVDAVQLPASPTACARHRNIQEACFASTEDLHIVKLLEKPYAADTTDHTSGEETGELSVATCTCVVTIEVEEDAVNPVTRMTNDAGGACEAAA